MEIEYGIVKTESRYFAESVKPEKTYDMSLASTYHTTAEVGYKLVDANGNDPLNSDGWSCHVRLSKGIFDGHFYDINIEKDNDRFCFNIKFGNDILTDLVNILMDIVTKCQSIVDVEKLYMNYLSKLVDNGNTKAMLELALCYEEGKGVEDNEDDDEDEDDDDYFEKSEELYNKAVSILRERADNGDIEAQLELGCYYFDDTYDNEDIEESINWLIKAAESGSSDAFCILESMFESDEALIAPEYEKARDYIYGMWQESESEQDNSECVVEDYDSKEDNALEKGENIKM